MKHLVLPNPPWGVKAPTPSWHPTPGVVPNPREDARRAAARQLADEAIAALDVALVEAARQAYVANNAASAALNAAQAELLALNAEDTEGTDADLDDATLEAHELRRLFLERHIPTLRRRLTKAQQDADTKLGAVRSTLALAARFGAFERIRVEARQKEADAERLLDEASDLRLAVNAAESILGAWLPPKEVTDG